MAEIFSYNTPLSMIVSHEPYGIILSGSPYFPWQKDAPQIDHKIFELGIPVLGLCYGLYLITEYLGGKVVEQKSKEYGLSNLEFKSLHKLVANVPSHSQIWMNHGGEASGLEKSDVKIIGSSGNTKYAAFYSPSKNLYALQFHPEVSHTAYGKVMLENFVFKICKAKKNWQVKDWVENKVQEVSTTLEDRQALCAISGGVDSTTAAILVGKAIGKNLHCVFVDTGLMRQDEPREVEDALRKLDINLTVVHAQERFLSKLAKVTDPETKRKIIGKEYIDIFEEEAKKLGKIDYLVQGTIYSDKIESQQAQSGLLANKIKSHHNVGGLPEKMNLKLIEPLDTIFKDEVRQVARILGLPEEIAGRHPFPGPGLAIQIVGAVNEENLRMTREADAIVIEEIRRAGLYNQIGEIFANFTNVKTTGVKGDERVYEWMIGIRSVDPSDLMTSSWSRITYEVLDIISTRIVNEVRGVCRVVYDITNKPPGTIRWE